MIDRIQTPSERKPRKHKNEIPDFNLLPRSAALRIKHVAVLTSKGESTIWREIKEGTFPSPRYPTPRFPVWLLGDVLDFNEGNWAPDDSKSQ